MFNWFSRGRAFYYICFLSAIPYLTIITKMIYHEPRPFMVDDKIKVFGCTDEYGNPSGHALFTAGGHFFVFLDIFHSEKEKKFSRPVYFILLFLTISLSFLVGFARFYLGLHTINQIVYGWSLGIFLAFYFHICLRDTIIEHVDNYLLSRHNNLQISYGKYIILNSILVVFTFSSQLITYIFT